MSESLDDDQPVVKVPAKRQTIRQAHRSLTRNTLAEAAFAEFAEKGYAAATIEDIAKRAGTSRATFYVHFSGKVELVDGLWDLVRRHLVTLYRDLAAMEVRTPETLRAWLRRTFDFYEENRQQLLAIHEAIVLEPDMAQAYLDRIDQVTELVIPLIREDHTMSVESAHFRASVLTMQHERFCFFWILRGMPFDAEQAEIGLAQVWFEYIGHGAS